MPRLIIHCGALILAIVATAAPGLSQAQNGLAGNFPSSAVFDAVTRDASGAIFAAGGTTRAGFATPGAYEPQLTPTVCPNPPGTPVVDCSTGAVEKLNAAGQIVWATYLGGASLGPPGEVVGSDTVNKVLLDSHGNVWVSGTAQTANFPITPNAYQTTRSIYNYFLSELSPDGSQLLYSTFTNGQLLAIDPNDGMYLVGTSIFKFDPSSNRVVYTVTAQIGVIAGAVDETGALYVAGSGTLAYLPPTPGVYAHPSAGYNLAVMGIDPNGDVMFSTLIGGAGNVALSDMALDSAGNIYLTGIQEATASAGPSLDIPTTPDALQSNWNPPFLLKLSPDASTLLYGTFLGKSNLEAKYATGVVPVEIKVGPDGKVRMVVDTQQNDIPLTPDSFLPCHPAPLDFDQPKYWIYLQFSADLHSIEYATDIPSTDQTFGPFYFDTSGNAYLSIQPPPTGAVPPFFEVLNVSQAPHSGPVCMGDYVTQSATAAAPGLMVSILGPGIGPSQQTPTALDAAGRVATQLAGTEVLFDGIPAPIISAGPSRVDVVVPFGVATSGTTTISVFQDGSLAGTLTNSLAGAAAKMFTLDGTGYGAAAWNQDGTPNSAANPAAAGDILTFYGTGAGAMTPAVIDGTIPQFPQASPNLQVSIGGFCTTTYSGDAPGLVEGIFQYNCRINNGFGTGMGQFGIVVASPDGSVSYNSYYDYTFYTK